jgi:predicted NUDIX family NTP pyrophosphohydrolase
MKKQSAGLLLYRTTNNNIVEVLLVHPGGPYWMKKDQGAWSIPKGEFEDEDPLAAAQREFTEELGIPVPEGEIVELGSAKQTSGKVVYAWAVQADVDPKHVKSNMFSMEWPPKSGKTQDFPEVDKAQWFAIAAAQQKLVKGQVLLLEKLVEILGLEAAAAPPGIASQSDAQTSLFDL